MVVHIYNPSTGVAESRRIERVLSQLGLHSQIVSQKIQIKIMNSVVFVFLV
jgi:hypothetical protein